MALGFGIGAVAGAAGGFIQADAQRRQQTRFRRRQRKAINEAREFAGGTTVKDGTFVDPTTGERVSGGRVDEILADPILSGARNFLAGSFGNAANSPLAQDFALGIRQAQAARGTGFGGAAINEEAGGLAAFSQRLQADLLPQALAFGTLGENLRQNVTGFEARLRTAAATGGGGLGDSSNFNAASPFAALLSGALSGGAGGFSLDRQFGLSSGIFGGGATPAGEIGGTVTGRGGSRSGPAIVRN